MNLLWQAAQRNRKRIMSKNETSPLMALQKAGALPKNEYMKQIINGAQTITPIVAHLIEKNSSHDTNAFPKILSDIKELQVSILKKAVDVNYDITPLHYVAINRLALNIVCTPNYKNKQISNDDIALWCSELFDLDDFYAENMQKEFTDDDFALQFIAISELAGVISNFLITAANTNDSDDIFAEVMRETIELVDSHIDTIYEQFINPLSATHVRSHLIKQSSIIMNAILNATLKSSSSSHINIPLILKKFELAYKGYIEAITINASSRGRDANVN